MNVIPKSLHHNIVLNKIKNYTLQFPGDLIIMKVKNILAKNNIPYLFSYLMIGFDEIYFHDLRVCKSLLINNSTGEILKCSYLNNPKESFEEFKTYCKDKLAAKISLSGDGYLMFPEEFDQNHSFREIANNFKEIEEKPDFKY